MKAPRSAWRNIDLVDIISDLSPWLTPIPSAVLVANATIRHLAWATPVGWVAGAIVEMLGISTVDTTMRFYNWNNEKRQSDPRLPWALPAALVGVYFSATVVLTVLLDTVPLLARWSPVIFPILALVGAINLVLRRNYRFLARRVAEEKDRMRVLREMAKTAREATQLSAELPETNTLLGQIVQPPAPQEARFICHICIQGFKSENALNAHMRVHKGKKELDI